MLVIFVAWKWIFLIYFNKVRCWTQPTVVGTFKKNCLCIIFCFHPIYAFNVFFIYLSKLINISFLNLRRVSTRFLKLFNWLDSTLLYLLCPSKALGTFTTLFCKLLVYFWIANFFFSMHIRIYMNKLQNDKLLHNTTRMIPGACKISWLLPGLQGTPLVKK